MDNLRKAKIQVIVVLALVVIGLICIQMFISKREGELEVLIPSSIKMVLEDENVTKMNTATVISPEFSL